MAENLPLPVGIQENSLPLNVLANGTDPNDVLTWNGTTWISAPAGGGGGVPNIDGTANQVDVNIVDDVAVISLNNDIITPSSTTVSANVLTNTFTSNKTSLNLPNYRCNLTSTYVYATGEGYQDGTTIYATTNVFDQSVVGMILIFTNGLDTGTITSYIDPATITVSDGNTTGNLNFVVYDINMNIDNTLNFGGFAKAGVFSVLPNYPANLLGIAFQNGNSVGGDFSNFTSDMVGKRLNYQIYDESDNISLRDAGIIKEVLGSTDMIVETNQTVGASYYNIVYPGFYVDNAGQSFISGKAMEAEQISTSTALSTSVDSIIDSTGGILNCTLADGVENQVKTIKLKYILSNPVTVKCTFGSFTLTTNEPVRILRYLSGMWQIEDGVSACAPTPDSFYPTVQSGTKIVGTGYLGGSFLFGHSCSLSADGNTLAVGGIYDDAFIGATWIFTRSGTIWTQQAKLVGTGNIGSSQQGWACSLSANGDTLATTGYSDNGFEGATWIFVRSGTTWTQQAKLFGTGNIGTAVQGWNCCLSASGDILATTGLEDDSNQGATWIFTRTGTTWTQQAKLVGTGNIGAAHQGVSCSLSASGSMLAVGGNWDNGFQGAVWIFTYAGTTWTQQAKLVGTGNIIISSIGWRTSLSADGNTLAASGPEDNDFQGAIWIFTRSENNWSQQAKLIGTGNIGSAQQGYSCALSADGNTLAVGGSVDNDFQGATWIFTRSGDQWIQNAKLIGTGNTGSAQQGYSCALSSNGNILAVGGAYDAEVEGAVWIFV